MGIRMSGMVSGLDTENIISELMKAKSAKKTKIEGDKTKLEWKQEKWAELNTKLYKLYTDYASKMKLQGSYKLKKASSSNETAVSIKANANATDGSYSMQISQLAKSQYVTGAKIDDSALEKGVKTSTKLSALDSSMIGTEITIKSGDKTVRLQVKEDTKISDVVTALNSAGLNASFDETQKRFFIGAKNSGADNGFSITTSRLSNNEIDARKALEDSLNYANLSSADKKTVDESFERLRNGNVGTEDYTKAAEALENIAIKNGVAATSKAATDYVKALLSKQVLAEKGTEYTEAAKLSYLDVDEETGTETVKSATSTGILKDLRNSIIKELKEAGTTYTDTDIDNIYNERLVAAGGADAYVRGEVDKKVAADVDKKVATDVAKLLKNTENIALIEGYKLTGVSQAEIESELSAAEITKYGVSGSGFDSMVDSVARSLDNVRSAITAYNDVENGLSSEQDSLSAIGIGDVMINEQGENISGVGGMAVVAGQDSIIKLNGAELTSNSNSIIVNGLTIELKSETAANEKITFSVSNDIDATYNLVKDFIKSYNEILSEMNELYHAKSARGYNPLTDEEKEAMSDKQVELWEDKIKGALFRSDTTMGSVTTAMKSAMMSSVNVNGKNYSLSSLGIMTSTNYLERGLLHIYGDQDDSTYMAKNDKLKTMLTEDPELAIQILTGVAANLSDAMNDKMKTSSISSAMTFYNDKQMKKQTKEYETQISMWEQRLHDMENRYYKQFTAMEKAMSGLNSQGSYFSSLLGN